jgi:hypothetical protein
MAIYRGPGGPGDATTDATNEATVATTKAGEAAASATAAAASASSASTSATTATTQATSATTSATNAATSASNASTSETNAATSASAAATSATAALSSQENAETAETNASASATSAASSATSASTSATTATTQAGLASTSATNAATSEVNAGTSATTATTKASEAATSAFNASTSETNAASSASTASSAATTATTQASNASTSATNASTSETNAASSASAAATSATNAATSETNAANSASAASTSATNAATSETNAAASYDAFDDRYLGAKSSAPTVDNDGDALLTGAIYWNTTNDQLYVWTGSAWDEAAFSVSGSVTSFNTRTGAVTLSSGDVTTALGFTPQDAASAVSAINDLSDVVITTPSTNQILKYNGTNWVNGSDTDTGILYTDLSVTTAAAGSPALAYNNTNGVFTYTPPDLTSYITASSTDTFTNKSGNISQWTNDSGYLTSETYTGTVTSVAATVPVGFTIAGSPVTTSGTLAISFDTGYSLPTTASQTNWNTAYGWGNHATAGYLTSANNLSDVANATTARSNLGLVIGTDVQAYDADTAKLDVVQTFTANQTFADGVRADFGTGPDFSIFHDGTNTYLTEFGDGTGNTYLRANNLQLLNNANEIYVNCTSNGTVGLYYDNAIKLGTTSIGIDVTGTVTTDRATGTVTTDNDLSFDLSATNNFSCTPSSGAALTFTNHTAGQSGYILLDNSAGVAITAAATTKINATDLTTISTAGVYLVSYFDNGTNAYITVSATYS